ncbi:pimeloyl-ACP methyl ester carboxylesterase [Microbacterium foliorum]|uniref:Pimeloyl-ACP methyl ester carboxylesterase n=1 Tax=Microbacterium foliorum TaxID=104336 RepID=A0ABU1HVF2_9MICO|nr:alpha/beta hydrolase [Microbacterium foliorum]MDR6144035.1 pimeloyl-ACP methyl ester carboxylesterase [Microbacterium foliorum]
MRVRYAHQGSGRPLVLLHGSGSSLETFDPIVERLARRAKVIRLDLPGFGHTGPRPDGDYRIETFARTVARALTALGVRGAVVAGNSLGGNIAWNLALEAPELVEGLVLINATGYPGKALPLPMRLARNPIGRVLIRLSSSRSGVARSVRSTVGPGSSASPELIERTHANLTRPGNLQAFIDFSRTDQTDRTRLIRHVTVPVMVLRSAGMAGQRFAADLPHAAERVHLTGGHLLPDEDPGWLADALDDFLDDLDQEQGR